MILSGLCWHVSDPNGFPNLQESSGQESFHTEITQGISKVRLPPNRPAVTSKRMIIFIIRSLIYLGCWLLALFDWRAQMNFDGVEVNWTPWAYLYRKGRGSQRWCYSFQANSDNSDSDAVLGVSRVSTRALIT